MADTNLSRTNMLTCSVLNIIVFLTPPLPTCGRYSWWELLQCKIQLEVIRACDCTSWEVEAAVIFIAVDSTRLTRRHSETSILVDPCSPNAHICRLKWWRVVQVAGCDGNDPIMVLTEYIWYIYIYRPWLHRHTKQTATRYSSKAQIFSYFVIISFSF